MSGRRTGRHVLRAVFLCALMLCGGAVAASHASAAIGGACYDGAYYDGLDGRPSAQYCANALTARGFQGFANSNQPATSASVNFISEPGAFAFNGHTGVVADYNNMAAAAMFDTGPPNHFSDGILGDEKFVYEERAYACSPQTGQCSNDPAEFYPMNVRGASVVSLDGCFTARGFLSFTSMAVTAYNQGADNIIDFGDATFCPTAPNTDTACQLWERVFWQQLGAGATYLSATETAANALGYGYGYGSYGYIHAEGSWTLDPPLSGGAASLTLATSPPWTSRLDDGRTTTSWPANTIGSKILAGFGRDRAVELARNVAAPTLPLDGLLVRTVERLDHGEFAEWRVVFQARSPDGVWLPHQVAVGLNPSSGAKEYVSTLEQPVPEYPHPQVDEPAARQRARELFPWITTFKSADLELRDGRPTWILDARQGSVTAPRAASIITVDAASGSAREDARAPFSLIPPPGS